jgi:hypothetical protein
MEKLKLFPKILFFISLSSLSIWIGANFVKVSLLFNLFQPLPNLPLKSLYSNLFNNDAVNFNSWFTILKPIFSITVITFYVYVVFQVLFLLFSRINIKNNGWIFLSLILTVILLGFELYLNNFDMKLITSSNINPKDTVELIRLRINKIPNFVYAEILMGLTILFLMIFQPLVKKEKNVEL